MKTTNKERIERYESLNAHADLMDLVAHDLVNGKFSMPVRIWCKEYEAEARGFYQVRVSDRAMPVYLVEYHATGQSNSVTAMTEAEIEDRYRNVPISMLSQILYRAMGELRMKAERRREVMAGSATCKYCDAPKDAGKPCAYCYLASDESRVVELA